MSTAILPRNQTTRSGFGEAVRLLAAASDRELVAIISVIDRAHVVQTEPSPIELATWEVVEIQRLLATGLAQLGGRVANVLWHDGSTVSGRPVLPTEDGLALLALYRRYERYGDPVATAWAGVGE